MEYVILDIETTGLDPEYSSIIEIGAIIVSGNKIISEFVSFVAYNEEVPDNIKRLTGITDEMLKDAPPLSKVLKDLRTFIGKRPVVSHNGFSFDYRMLERNKFSIDEKYDSMELAFFVLPTNPTGHSTKALSEYFSLKKIPHRALEDCKIEFEVINQLLKKFSSLPKKKAAVLKSVANRGGWWWTQFLHGEAEQIEHLWDLVDPHKPYRKRDAEQERLLLQTKKINIERVKALFTPQADGGQYSEDRPEQREMALTVANTFNACTHCVIEAGTGVGKSKAYLVPAVLFALENQIPVIISTFTKALQDQLFFKEIPHLRDITRADLRVAVIKGKHNYVCLGKFEKFIDDALETPATRSLYASRQDGIHFTTRLVAVLLSSWAVNTERGDWDELPYWLIDRMPKDVEQKVCNSDELCTNGTCKLYDKEQCFLAKARLRARDADLVVANHAVVLSGIIPDLGQKEAVVDETEGNETIQSANRSHVIFPNEARFLVIDEAHHLEEAATSAWSEIVSAQMFQRLFQQFYGERGVDGLLASVAEKKNSERLAGLADNFAGLEKDTRLIVDNLFNDLIPAMMPVRRDAVLNNWSEFMSFEKMAMTPEHSKIFIEALQNIGSRLQNMNRILTAFSEEVDSDPVFKKILSIRARGALAIALSIEIITDNGPSYARYVERRGSITEIKADLVSVAKSLKDYVYDNFASVILTSATITTDKNFNFFAERCGTNLVDENRMGYRLLSSSFDYSKQVKFFVPEGIAYSGAPEGQRRHYALARALTEEGVIASGGGALILCSSHEQVGKLYSDLVRPFAKGGLYLLRQVRGRSIGSVVREFAEDTHSVLVGTRSLWQGVDVPGSSLRALFIYKLPYLPPGNPVTEARQEAVRSRGGNGFADYYEPLAVLALKQGFGRLIRKATDIGVVVMMDDRILQRRAFTKSFPAGVEVRRATREEILAALSALREAESESSDS